MNTNLFFLSSFRIVFSSPLYVIISVIATILFWIILNVAGELLFFSPIWVFYLPNDAIFGFMSINITVAFEHRHLYQYSYQWDAAIFITLGCTWMRRAHAFGEIGGSATDTPSLKKHVYSIVQIELRAVCMSDPVIKFVLHRFRVKCHLILHTEWYK